MSANKTAKRMILQLAMDRVLNGRVRRVVEGCVLLPLFLTVVTNAQTPDGPQKSFRTPGEAAKALFEAAKADDSSALLEILGPDGKELVSSGDDVADKNDRATFVKNYEQRHRLIGGSRQI